MRKYAWLFVSIGFAAQAGAGDAQHRELGAHEHGRGILNIAVEGVRVSMELAAPGADIVGFEHAATTREQKEAIAQAKTALGAPQSLFQIPASAGCAVEEAKVAVESEDRDHAKEQGTASHKSTEAAGKEPADHDERGHSQFHVQYTFNCKAPANITAIEFGYFRTFAGAQKLDVNVITAKGQTRFEVTRAKPRIDLAGQM